MTDLELSAYIKEVIDMVKKLKISAIFGYAELHENHNYNTFIQINHNSW